MARIDEIKDFAGHWNSLLGRLKPGDQVVAFIYDFNREARTDWSIEQAEAKLLHSKFGALRDDTLRHGQWLIDWSDKMSTAPTVRLAPDLFEHVSAP